ncbi:hypothetical protein [Nocardioides sp. GXZ039]|uniref:hypothetical protein n=1 Tax=Nocardioides sp. GXZ039 TaxID=3136018 RepID=UPI0030F45E2F
MALTPGSRRREKRADTVFLSAEVAPEAREQMKAMAAATGLSLGLFIEQLVKVVEVDENGRPLALPFMGPRTDESFPGMEDFARAG